MNRFRYRPSPAMVVAIIALFVGASGGAVAAALITGAQVKDGSLTGRDVKDLSIAGRDIKNGSLGTAKLSSSALASLKQATTLFAEVSPGASPTILNGHGVTGVTSAGDYYIVTFNRDVTGCAPFGTTNGTSGNNSFRVVNVVHRSGGPTQLNVATFEGLSTTFVTSVPFSVAVFCP